jgi:AcrR family transcriptional regulator
MVASRAGTSKATIYRWWSSKEELVIEALGRFVSSFPTPDTGKVREDLHALMAHTTGLFRDPDTRPLFCSLTAAMERSPAIARAVHQGFHGVRRDAVCEVLQRGKDRGELPPQLDVLLVHDLLTGPLFYRLVWTRQPLDESLTHEIVETLLRGVCR